MEDQPKGRKREKLDRRIEFLVSESMLTDLERIAAEQSESISTTIRALITKEIKRRKRER